MSEPRFQVATCDGFRIRGNLVGEPSGTAKPGLSATVCDTLHQWKEVKTYRSEDRGPWPERGGYRGRAQTVVDATDHADYLNRLYGDD